MELIASGRLKTTTGEAFNFLTVSIYLGGCATQLDIVRKIGRGLKASRATKETIQRVAKASWDWLTNWEVLGVRFHKDEAELDPEEVSEELVQKLAHAIALEGDQPSASVSPVARKHGIVTAMLFRWRVQFGVTQKKRAKLAPVALTDDTPTTLLLSDLVQLPDGMTAIDLSDGRRVFARAAAVGRVQRIRQPARKSSATRRMPSSSNW